MNKKLTLALVLIFSLQVAAKVVLHSGYTHIEITGGTGANSWKLIYGTTFGYAPRLLEVSPARAYFSQGGWIRLIDTTQGIVLGRWHIGPPVVSLKPTGEEQVDAEVLDDSYGGALFGSSSVPVLHDSVIIGPSSKVRLLPTETFERNATGDVEARFFPPVRFGMPKLAPDKAREWLPAVEDMARRDPFLPWLRVLRAYLLQQVDDPRAANAFDQVLQSSGGDFSDWLPISSYLYEVGKNDLAAAAYDRGYKDFLERGYDPRLMQSIFHRVALFSAAPLTSGRLLDLPSDQMERGYWLEPYPEFAWIIWQRYADMLAGKGLAQQAQLWSERARDARQNAPALREYFGLHFDRLILPLLMFAPALLVFVVAVSRRYSPQRRADMEAGRRKWAVPILSNLAYWTVAERFALLLMAVAGWVAMGLCGIYATGWLRAHFMPHTAQAGIYTGPIVRWHFQDLPPSPERDLLLAMTYQQSGDSRRAEDLYRKLPQFGASWNNLGVLLKRRGRSNEAREAFQRALQVEPQLHEAQFNLEGATPDLWTHLHKQFVPERPMLAIARQSQIQAAYRGGSSARVYFWAAVRGPFWPGNAHAIVAFLRGPSPRAVTAVRMLSEVFWVTVLVFAICGILLVRRRQHVTENPGARHRMLKLMLPGTSRSWNVFGGVVLVGWFSCWLALALYLTKSSPLLITAGELWYLRWYSGSLSSVSFLNPSWLWFALAIIAMFAVNAALVLPRRVVSATPAAVGSGG